MNVNLSSAIDGDSGFIADKLTNYSAAKDGFTLPPRQRGPAKVPSPGGFKLVQTASQNGNTVFTLAWDALDPALDFRVDHYNIYYTLASSDSAKLGPFAVTTSPATIVIPAAVQTGVTFYLQTVLQSGLLSPLGTAPTVSGFLQSPLLGKSNLSFTLLTGMSIQPFSYTHAITGTPKTTQLVNIASGGGGLLTVAIRLDTAGRNANSCNFDIQITADGQAAQSFRVYSAAGSSWLAATQILAQAVSGGGGTGGDYLNIYVGLGFNTSLVVSAVQGGNTGTGDTSLTDVAVAYATLNP